MANKKLKKYYVIEGYDSTNLIFRKEIPVGCITDDELSNLLKCLTAKASLSFDEIVGGYLKKGSKLRHHLLDVYKDQSTIEEWENYHMNGKMTKLRWSLYTGVNPSFIVTVIEK